MTRHTQNIELFLQSRNFKASKAGILRYLSDHSDGYRIIEGKRGGGIQFIFDEGAYKGQRILSFSFASLTPLDAVRALKSLTGWSFGLVSATENFLEQQLKGSDK